ncbi:MAG TPA: DNA polymerase III subunit gamma/tau [Anaerolineaceae bacterium]
MSQALYRKWRPHLWNQVVGQDHVVRTLQNAIRNERVGHAYLFAGPRGTGKTTTARLLAKAVNCLDPNVQNRPCDHCDHCVSVNDGRFMDLIEIDAASNTSVDDVRDLRDKINFSPSQGRYKVYIIDEVHMLSTAAFNALLKTLEEPPPHAIFILATTEMHKIPATVLSRCQRHEFRRIPVPEISAQLKMLCKQEKIKIDEDALLLIARQATGSMRDAISLLDQLSSTGEHITLATAQKVLGTATNQIVIELVDSIQNRQAGLGLNCIQRALDSGSDPRQFARQMVDYLRGLLLVRLAESPDQVEATPEIRQQMVRHAEGFELPKLLEAIRLFNTAATDTRSGWQPGLLLELALAEAVEEKNVPPPGSSPASAAAARNPISDSLPHQAATPPQMPAAAPSAEATSAPAEVKPAPAALAKKPTAAPEAPSPVKEPQTPPPARPAEVSPGPAASPLQKNTFQDILNNWPRIRAVVKKARVQTEGLMNSCKPLTIKDGVLVLGFLNDLLKKKMETGDNVLVIRQGIYTVMSIEIPILCVVMNNKISTDLPSDFDIEGDGIVGTALNLGGKIVQKD